MREGDVIQRPEKLDVDTLPWVLVLDAQFGGSFNFLRAFEADILAVLLQEMEQNHLAQTVAGRPVRHA
ncbi:MAG TPA: hypothetical protein VG148_12975 [Pyrinomonadaceae bacterium]|nr:hypothetical protein [Pyrinomonadaceae bacterium]